MSTLLAVGMGYCARHYVEAHPAAFGRVVGTARTGEGAQALRRAGVEAVVFDGHAVSEALREALGAADVLLLSVPPDVAGDPLLRHGAAVLEQAPRLRQVVYLTTLGVYGDHRGGWVDEATPPKAGSERLERRLAAETAWRDFGRETGVPVAVLRLAGIYGPGRNALEQIRAGDARRIEKPGQVFNRIHVDDISAAIQAVVQGGFDGIVNVTDDHPTPPGDPLVFAARLLGVDPPPPVPFEVAAEQMSPMALSFWAASKRVRNARLKDELGVRLRYPTYQEGLSALHTNGRSGGA